MDIRQVVHITLADQAPKIIDGYWHEWVDGEWINTGVKAEGNDGTNHLIMGFFSDKIQYKLSPAGIPVVKRPDGSQGNFSVFELTAPQSTFNPITKKGTFVPSEWKLVENVDFIYMQEAYIERLQAVLITAENIEALMIRTANLEVLNGAKVGNWNVEGGNLSSDYASGASLRVEQAGGRFLRINDSENAAMLGIRSDGGTALSLYTQGGSAGVGVSIAAQTGATAIKSSGSHQLYQRGGESWNTPGILLAIDIVVSNIPVRGTGYFNQRWNISPLDSGVTLTRTGRDLRLNHNLGHSDYFVTAFINAGAGEMEIGTKTSSYCDLVIAGSYSESHTVTIMVFGRNKLQ